MDKESDLPGSGGFVVLCIDNPVVRELKSLISARMITYGVSEDADYQLIDFQFNFHDIYKFRMCANPNRDYMFSRFAYNHYICDHSDMSKEIIAYGKLLHEKGCHET